MFVFAGLFLAMTSAPSEGRAGIAESGQVTIRTDFPGGNALVEKNQEGTVNVAPDLRGDRPWFYWCFEAKATRAGRVRFVFPETVIGFKNGAIGFQGPAVSMDLGATWGWMGTDHVEGSAFVFDFSKPEETVRFAVTIPYLQANLDAFLKKNAANRHLKTSLLTTSRHGRPVELLRIGEPGPSVRNVLVTARHHASETIASYVLEGFLQAAMSERPEGVQFRKHYVLYAVPFVDKDGVEEGDQGKNRKPHDHNRDYGATSLYPEVQAIRELDQARPFQFSLDFHCPTLVMDSHQVMYFDGPRDHPAANFDNVSELASQIKRGLPKGAPVGPLVWLKPATTPKPMNSHYFGFKADTIMAATLEMPFAPPGKATDPASCRGYGEVILRAWVNTHFKGEEPR
ncbi:MAG: M14 family zinc carboxypeptidase [Isosphaeraceae bacterium]